MLLLKNLQYITQHDLNYITEVFFELCQIYLKKIMNI